MLDTHIYFLLDCIGKGYKLIRSWQSDSLVIIMLKLFDPEI